MNRFKIYWFKSNVSEMVNLIGYLTNYLGMFYSILIVSLLCLSLSLLLYYYKYYKLSFFLLYVSLTYDYLFVLLNKNVFILSATYCYYISIFLSYHFYFTFSKRFYSRTIVVVKKYLNSSDYLKLILWIVLVFITALLGEVFIFWTVFNALFAFSLVTENYVLFFFLLIQWIWIFILIFLNKFNICNNFLSKILNYFSRKACLHYIGNNAGNKLQRLGAHVLIPLVTGALPAGALFMLSQESATGNYAAGQMYEHQVKHPNSTQDEQYNTYQKCYKLHANSSMTGRLLTYWGVLRPAAPEVIIPDYKSNLEIALKGLDKK